jgi:hypothetical protein
MTHLRHFKAVTDFRLFHDKIIQLGDIRNFQFFVRPLIMGFSGKLWRLKFGIRSTCSKSMKFTRLICRFWYIQRFVKIISSTGIKMF